MAWTLFGWNIKRAADDPEQQPKSFAPPQTDDGAAIIQTPSIASGYNTLLDLDGTIKAEAELVTKYRSMFRTPEVGKAVTEICNEAIIKDDTQETVELNLDKIEELPDQVKDIIEEEFKNILLLLEWNTQDYEIFKRWYIDGRLYYHAMIDNKNPRLGIQQLRYLDPRRLKKVKQIKKTQSGQKSGATLITTQAEYYVYNEKGFDNVSKPGDNQGPQFGLKIAPSTIVFVSSGLLNEDCTMVLSYLDQAIRYLNMFRTIQDAAVIYRLVRAPQRRVFYIDIGNLSKGKAEEYMRDMMVRHKNKLNYNAETGQISDTRKFMCYALDTKIPLLDGRTLTLQQIMDEYETGKTNWVYSCDPITGKFVPGPISWAGITKRNSQVVRITFDNGKSVICTPDHKFPVWGKGFVEAKDILGESIIPGYRRKKRMYGTNTEYEQIYRNEDKKWVFTHREVAKWKDNVGIREELIHLEKYAGEKKLTVHHRNYNNMDNSPDNLVMMHNKDHIRYHWDMAKFGAGRRINTSEDFTAEWKTRLSEKAKQRIPTCKTWKITLPDGETEIVENLSAFCRNNGLNRSNIKGKFGSKKYFAEELRNHKATSVEWLDEKIDVGCLTVDLDETYHSNHTYLLDAGVYTKNTMLEDYWLSRRGDGAGTKIENLEGAADWGVLPEVQHFLKMLYTSLNVPIGRLDSEMAYSIGKASEITREEVSFTKFIDRIRARFAELFLELLERQLILKGIMRPEEFNVIRHQIKFKWGRDSRYAEMSEAEIRNERYNSLVMIQPFIGQLISNEEVRKTILKQTEEDIKRIDAQIMAERESPIYMAQVGLGGEPLPPGQSAPEGADAGAEFMPPEPKETTKKNK